TPQCLRTVASVGAKSQYERTRPLSGGCREKTLNNHINVDALIQKGACNEARQVYGDGCSTGNDRGGCDRCGRPPSNTPPPGHFQPFPFGLHSLENCSTSESRIRQRESLGPGFPHSSSSPSSRINDACVRPYTRE